MSLESDRGALSPHIRPIPTHVAEGSSYYQEIGALDAMQPERQGRSLKDYFQMVIKYRWLIIVVSAVLFVLTALYSFLATPMYTAKATLKISTYAPLLPGVGIEDVMMKQSREANYAKTQVEILTGLSLADAVLSDGERGTNVMDYLKRGSDSFSLFGTIKGFFASDDNRQSRGELDTGTYSFPVNSLRSYLGLIRVKPIRGTSLVAVSATTSNPQLSAEVANAHSAAFIELTRQERQRSTLDNLVYLKAQAQELADKVALAERELAAYAEENAIVSLNKDENIVVKQMAELNQLLTTATARRIKSESQFNEATSGSGLNSTAFDDDSILELRVRLKEAESEYALLGEKFKPNFPKMIQLKARIDTLQEKLTEQRQQAVKGLEAKYKADLGTEQELREQLEIQKSKAFELSRREVQYNIMKREYESLKDLHQTVLRQLKEAQLTSQSSGSNITVTDPAAVPLGHSKPKRTLNMLLALIIGPLLGCALAFVAEALDNTIKTPEEAERLLNVPALGVVPMFALEGGGDSIKLLESRPTASPGGEVDALVSSDGSKELLNSADGLVTHSAPASIASEAFRALRTSILLSSADHPPRVILVTSGQKAEGKTTVAANLAVTLAQSGHPTVLIDGDLRRPAVHRQFSIDQVESGLVDYLTGLNDIEQVVVKSKIDNLTIIPAGPTPPNPSELLGSKKMRSFLEDMAKEYEYVVLDSPPVLPVTDAALLSRFADGVVLVTRGQETARQVSCDASARLKQVGANILGVVLNDVDLRSGDYYYYRRGYYAYYRDDVEDSRRKKRMVG